MGDERDCVLGAVEQQAVATEIALDGCEATLAAAGRPVIRARGENPFLVAVVPARSLEASESDLVQLGDDDRRRSGPSELGRLPRPAERGVRGDVDGPRRRTELPSLLPSPLGQTDDAAGIAVEDAVDVELALGVSCNNEGLQSSTER